MPISSKDFKGKLFPCTKKSQVPLNTEDFIFANVHTKKRWWRGHRWLHRGCHPQRWWEETPWHKGNLWLKSYLCGLVIFYQRLNHLEICRGFSRGNDLGNNIKMIWYLGVRTPTPPTGVSLPKIINGWCVSSPAATRASHSSIFANIAFHLNRWALLGVRDSFHKIKMTSMGQIPQKLEIDM